jgi:hypothetical protein
MNAPADPDKSGHLPPWYTIVKSSLLVCPDLRGTLRPPVQGHAAKKDIPMLYSEFLLGIILKQSVGNLLK